MEAVQIPTLGRIVNYFPVVGETSKANNVSVLPAIVVQSWGNKSINIQVLTMNPDAPNVLRYSVYHQSNVPRDAEGKPLANYWAWPEKI